MRSLRVRVWRLLMLSAVFAAGERQATAGITAYGEAAV